MQLREPSLTWIYLHILSSRNMYIKQPKLVLCTLIYCTVIMLNRSTRRFTFTLCQFIVPLAVYNKDNLTEVDS